MAEASPGVDTEALEQAIDAELELLATGGLSDEEYERAQAMLLASEAFDSETISGLAEELGGWAVDADWRHALDRGYRHGQVEPEQVREVTARLLDRERRVVGWCLPEVAGDAGGAA
jgi:predicted Zn-dependent peptidase